MINVKLLVLFICISNIGGCCCDYCRICPSHTLCMYKRPGPGPYCRSYDKTALITKEDVETIVNKINLRRNFVALGLARNLPSAANMNQMRWSEELALSAQRWADQCDPAVRPDRKDLCRDLVDTKVGQSIATVMGLSPGLSVKSFVEMWYMQALDYNGSVTYYNQSEGRKTDDFTQLIWAETTLVGCGKARFNIDDKGTMIDRFVCNFAPKGNVRGKPVYTIGYPATQCEENSHKDEKFTGLCKSVTEKPQRPMATTENSLLRIIYLPKNPVKLDMDPLRLDYKNREIKQDRLNLMRHQNLRHIPNSTRGLVHHIPPVRQQNIQELPNIAPLHDVIARQNLLGHSQNIYGAFYRTRSSIEHYRRNDYMRDTVNPNYYDINLEPPSFDGQCTRKSGIVHTDNACHYASEIGQPQCTRKAKERNEYILTSPPSCKKKDHASINACDSQKLTCMLNPATTVNNCNYKCHCLNIENPGLENRRRIPGEYVYYDYLPNLALRGGVEFDGRHPTNHHTNSITSLPKDQSTANYFTRHINIHKQITNTPRSSLESR
ncbi:uncharacterized protein LOC134649697 [Cydia amplana]|uniref:uncharacterized protein LOC134649697 n=1 Tax=Cydia amplana TaxID=1869771 RepID=UPI002FE5B69E